MIRLDESALICDFAETYHILDYRSLPATRAAILALGLRDNSRIKMRIADTKVSVDTLLQAIIADRLALLLWAHTADGANNTNRPASIYDKLMGCENQKSEKSIIAFDTVEEFERRKAEILGEV